MQAVEYNYGTTSSANMWLKNNDNLHNYEQRDNENYRIPNPRLEFSKKYCFTSTHMNGIIWVT